MAVVWGLPATVASAGPVQIIRQVRSVSVSAENDSESRTAPDAGPFNAAVSAEEVNDERSARAFGSMDSTLGDDRFTFSGTLSYAVQEAEAMGVADANIEALAVIVFALDEPRRFALTRTTTITNEDVFENFEFPIELNSHGGLGVGGGTENVTITGDDWAGTMRAGQYELVLPLALENLGSNTDLHDASVDYEVTLDFSAIDSGDGGGPNPIPLPPAALAGLSVMAGTGIFRLIRERLRDRLA